MAARIRIENISMTAFDLVEMMTNGELTIPRHQREFVWTLKKQQKFLDSVLMGMPTSSILLRVERGDPGVSLEDGRQRLTTLQNFFREGSVLKLQDGRLYSDLPDSDKMHMRGYSFSVVRYRGATPAQVIEIFDRAQNGQPLNVGQRLYSMVEISPLVGFARDELLTQGSRFHDRAALIWGARNGLDAKRNIFKNAVMLAMMAAFGEATKKWEEIMDKMFLANEFNLANARDVLDKLITIYEVASQRAPVRGRLIQNKQWDAGNFSLPILWSLKTFPNEHPRLITGWTDFVVRCHVDMTLLDTVLKRDVGEARSWNDKRWRFGYFRVFQPDALELPLPALAYEGDEDDDEDTD